MRKKIHALGFVLLLAAACAAPALASVVCGCDGSVHGDGFFCGPYCDHQRNPGGGGGGYDANKTLEDLGTAAIMSLFGGDDKKSKEDTARRAEESRQAQEARRAEASRQFELARQAEQARLEEDWKRRQQEFEKDKQGILYGMKDVSFDGDGQDMGAGLKGDDAPQDSGLKGEGVPSGSMDLKDGSDEGVPAPKKPKPGRSENKNCSCGGAACHCLKPLCGGTRSCSCRAVDCSCPGEVCKFAGTFNPCSGTVQDGDVQRCKSTCGCTYPEGKCACSVSCQCSRRSAKLDLKGE